MQEVNQTPVTMADVYRQLVATRVLVGALEAQLDAAAERTPAPLALARETVRQAPCPVCRARPGWTCDGKGGMHLGRFAEAHRFGELPEDRMAAVLAAAGDVFTAETIIPAGAR